MGRQTKFPLKVSNGSVTVTIYRKIVKKKPSGEGRKTYEYAQYVLAYYPAGEDLKTETSHDFKALRARADEVLKDLAGGKVVDPDEALSAAERDEWVYCNQLLAPLGIKPSIAIAHYVEAVKAIGSDLVVLAAKQFATRGLNKVIAISTADAVKEYLTEMELKKRSDEHVRRLRIHLDRFAEAIPGNVADVTAPEIDKWLGSLKKSDGKPVGARTRDNHADSVNMFFNWAKLKRYASDDWTEGRRVTRILDGNEEEGEIVVYTPFELECLLRAAEAHNRDLIPFLCIGAFAGLRSSEILRLDWSDVKLDNGTRNWHGDANTNGCVVVSKSKNRRHRGKGRRVIPAAPNLVEWLKPFAKETGPVWPESEPQLYKEVQELCPHVEKLLWEKLPKAEFPFIKKNALRHSFISYRLELIKDEARVAYEANNTPDIIDSNYRALVMESDAVKWFNMRPFTS